MTKTKKIVVGALMSIITLGGLVTYASAGGHCGKFGGMGEQRTAFMISRISSKLDLTPVQKQNLIVLKDTIKAQKELHHKSSPREEVMKLLQTPVLDEAKLLATMDERMNKIRQAAPMVVTAIANFTNSLNDKQRAEIQTMAKTFKQHRGGHFGRHFKQHGD
ncbi:MAG: Spy/CpxP family protein refolding chaperone [Cocleimonas sp.]|nr:Spy/CpxP family protein refolding chaperone [Cocleimonas sp.]